VKTDGVPVKLADGTEVSASCEEAELSMADGKMVTTLTSLGGAYCTMCTKSLRQCHEADVIEAGIPIDRSVDSVRDLALTLMDPETGEIPSKRGDYAQRQGVTGLPISESNLTNNIPVCHSKMRSFVWFVELLFRERSHQKWYSADRPVTFSKEEKKNYEEAREYVKNELYTRIAVNVGNPGDMVTGNSFKVFSCDQSREVICSLVDEGKREAVNNIHLGLCAVVKIINSQKRMVNIQLLGDLCKEVYILIVTTFPWAVVSPSVHRILAHSAERIESNRCFGLGDESEEGLEHLNKYIRRIDQSGSRSDSTLHRYTDIFDHLWDRSRPTIVEMARKIVRKAPKIIIATEIEALVDSLFLSEGD
jgi:hypothetical protein